MNRRKSTRTENDLAASVSWGVLFCGCPCNENLAIWGLMFGNSHLVTIGAYVVACGWLGFGNSFQWTPGHFIPAPIPKQRELGQTHAGS